MGLFINQNDMRSKLQEKIAADLQEKVKRTQANDDSFDGTEDTTYLEGTKQTTTLAWAWVLIVVMAAGVVVLLLMQGR